MKGYGQFCPVAKASEILAERWTPLVLRELLCGSSRFNDIQRGVPLMSRSLLATRLKELERAGVVERRQAPGRRSHEYLLTAAGRELRPIIEGLGTWGQRWIVSDLAEADLDPSLLMWDMRRNIRRDELPARQVVVRFEFTDVPGARRLWWLLVAQEDADICVTDPGFQVDLGISVRLRDLTRYWLGQVEWGELLRGAAVALDGPPGLRRSLPQWLGRSGFAASARRPAERSS
jgi:DNA-binding HxlR family transcriptional regulator